MNNRIKELSMKADIWCDQNYPDSQFYNLHWEEKFAELIVQECMDVVRDINQEYDGGSTVVNAAYEIKEHFGVEE